MNRSLISAIVMAIGYALIFVLILPLYDSLMATREALALRQQLITERTDQQKNVDELLKQYNVKQSAISSLGYLMPVETHVDEIIAGLQAAAQSSGLQASEYKINTELSAASGYINTNLGLSFSGTYSGLLEFLHQIEQSLRIYDVSEFSISRSNIGNSFSIEIKLNTYNTK